MHACACMSMYVHVCACMWMYVCMSQYIYCLYVHVLHVWAGMLLCAYIAYVHVFWYLHIPVTYLHILSLAHPTYIVKYLQIVAHSEYHHVVGIVLRYLHIEPYLFDIVAHSYTGSLMPSDVPAHSGLFYFLSCPGTVSNCPWLSALPGIGSNLPDPAGDGQWLNLAWYIGWVWEGLQPLDDFNFNLGLVIQIYVILCIVYF